jgi:hypothetical protein
MNGLVVLRLAAPFARRGNGVVIAVCHDRFLELMLVMSVFDVAFVEV